MRSLVTDDCLSYEVVEKDPQTGRHQTRRIEKVGPTGLITAGTRSLPPQLSTRTLEVPLRDDPDQTRAIMQAHAQTVDGTKKAPLDSFCLEHVLGQKPSLVRQIASRLQATKPIRTMILTAFSADCREGLMLLNSFNHTKNSTTLPRL